MRLLESAYCSRLRFHAFPHQVWARALPSSATGFILDFFLESSFSFLAALAFFSATETYLGNSEYLMTPLLYFLCFPAYSARLKSSSSSLLPISVIHASLLL